MRNKIIIGTRGSKLALWQAEWIKSELQKLYPDLDVELKKIKTTGDRILDVPLAKVGGKGLFVKEIEEALLRGDIDLAVHSMKDVPTDFPEGLHLAVITKREDPRDAFISQIQSSKFKIQSFKDLPHGAIIGTSSLRRSCQLLNIRPDLRIVQLRGNLDTRLRKLDEGQFDAIVLAAAGVKRLGLEQRITEILLPDVSLPAIGQGAVGIECRTDDEPINNLIKPLNHHETFICVKAERAFLKRLQGGCQVPIAAYARIEQQGSRWGPQKIADFIGQKAAKQNTDRDSSTLIIDGLVGSISGDRIIRGHLNGDRCDAESLGLRLAEDLLSKGADAILAEVYGRA
ncbi:MAG: hydroxymethylbilane synthase [Thermodesulfovibrionales bacterium]